MLEAREPCGCHLSCTTGPMPHPEQAGPPVLLWRQGPILGDSDMTLCHATPPPPLLGRREKGNMAQRAKQAGSGRGSVRSSLRPQHCLSTLRLVGACPWAGLTLAASGHSGGETEGWALEAETGLQILEQLQGWMRARVRARVGRQAYTRAVTSPCRWLRAQITRLSVQCSGWGGVEFYTQSPSFTGPSFRAA